VGVPLDVVFCSEDVVVYFKYGVFVDRVIENSGRLAVGKSAGRFNIWNGVKL